MEDSIEAAFIGVNAEVRKGPLPVGSKQFRCYVCNGALWLSPTSVKEMTARGAATKAACLGCFLSGRLKTPDGKPPEVMMPTRESMEQDWGKIIGHSEIRDMHAKLRRSGIKEWGKD